MSTPVKNLSTRTGVPHTKTKTRPRDLPDALDELEAPPQAETKTTALVKAYERRTARVSTTRLHDLVRFIDRAPKSTNGYLEYDQHIQITTPGESTLRFTVVSRNDEVHCGHIRYDGEAQTMGNAFGGDHNFTVERGPFTSLVRDLPKGRVAHLAHKKDTLRVECETSTYEFRTDFEVATADDFDDARVLGDDAPATGFFDTKATKNTFWFVHSHLSNDSLRPAMTCAVTDEYEGEQMLVGTDGHGLSLCPIKGGEFPSQMMIPQSAFQAVRGMHGDSVTIRSTDEDQPRHTLQCGNERFSWTEPDEAYPDWRNVIPDNETGRFAVLSPDEMLDAVNRIKKHTSTGVAQIVLELPRKGTPRLVADATETGLDITDGVEKLPFTEYDGPGCKVALNPKFLHRVIKSMKRPPVVFHHSAPRDNGTLHRALTVEGRTGRRALIMPMLLES